MNSPCAHPLKGVFRSRVLKLTSLLYEEQQQSPFNHELILAIGLYTFPVPRSSISLHAVPHSPGKDDPPVLNSSPTANPKLLTKGYHVQCVDACQIPLSSKRRNEHRRKFHLPDGHRLGYPGKYGAASSLTQTFLRTLVTTSYRFDNRTCGHVT